VLINVVQAGRSLRRVGVIVAIVVATVDVLYIGYAVFVQRATSDMPWVVPFVATYLGLLAVCALLSATGSAGSWRIALLGACAGGLVVLGFLALFSVGLPLFVMGLVSIAALVRAIRGATNRGLAAGASIAGAVIAVLVLLAGFEIADRIIACPPGAVSGGGSGFLTPSYSYTCQNGRTIVTWGQ
jgi:hypothetical protein